MDEQNKWQEIEDKVNELEDKVNSKLDKLQESWDKATDISEHNWGAIFLRLCEWVLIFVLLYQVFHK